jgi:DNA polymerase IV
MDTFFVSVERLFDQSLVGKPVVVGGDPDKRGVVAAASYEVRKFGVHSGMPIGEAKRRCPHAIFVRPKGRRYGEFSDKVMEILGNYSPKIEQVSVDEAYIDYTGCERLFGPVLKAASVIKNEIFAKLKLPASFGIAANKLISKIASKNFAKPNGIFAVPEGSEKDFLRPLHIKKLPGVGDHMFERLTGMGILTIGDLAGFDKELIVGAFGKYGEYLWESSNGISSDEVVIEYEAKSIGKETTFETDTLDIAFLSATLFELAEKIGRKLRREGFVAKTVTLKLRYSDFKTVTRRQTLPSATNRDDVIYEVARAEMKKLLGERVRVRLVGIQASNLARKDYQLSLLGYNREEKYGSFYTALDKIRSKFGINSVFKNVGEE